jgi:hypothetical protein
MDKRRIFVGVVGFSDVERHALNTVFRLSEERELSYTPWTPLTAPGASVAGTAAQVVLVDGDSAEAVLSHAKETPAGQRLIWVGSDPPAHAWRVHERPIQWANVLHDLDTVYSAGQVDSGLIDLDVSMPMSLDGLTEETVPALKRVLLVGVEEQDLATLRRQFALPAEFQLDEVFNTEAAIECLGRHQYCCGVFNLDNLQVDVWSLAGLFRKRFPDAMTIALSQLAGPLGDWWKRRRVKRHAREVGVSALLSRPIHAEDLDPWIELL